jgi:hypothetical protein
MRCIIFALKGRTPAALPASRLMAAALRINRVALHEATKRDELMDLIQEFDSIARQLAVREPVVPQPLLQQVSRVRQISKLIVVGLFLAVGAACGVLLP